jgi:hypothetical protein
MAVALVTFALASTRLSTGGDASAATTTSTIPSSCEPTVSTSSPALPPAPSGVIAYDIYNAKQGIEPFPSSIFDKVSGVDLSIGWDDLEPDVTGSPLGVATPVQWSVLNCLFAEADHYGKFVILTMVPGFHTPGWALDNVDAPEFAFQYHEPPYPAAAALPEPWNQTYLSRWYAFLRKVAKEYDANPEFEMVAAAGPTSVSTEMSLPNGTGDPALLNTVITVGSTVVHVDGSDVTMWRALHYSPDVDEAAWAESFKEYAEIFPDKYISFALTNGLPIGNPAVTTSSSAPTQIRPSPLDPSQVTATPLKLIAEGLLHKPEFVLQENGLAGSAWPASEPNPLYNFVKANCGTITTGYETKNPKYEGNLSDVIDKAVAGGAKYLEVYLSDVETAPSAEFASATSALTNNANCDPLSLRAVASISSATVPISVTATTSLDLSTGDVVNIFQNGRTVASCHTATCHVAVHARNERSTFSADVSYPGQTPLITVSTKMTIG